MYICMVVSPIAIIYYMNYPLTFSYFQIVSWTISFICFYVIIFGPFDMYANAILRRAYVCEQ